jgi:hypothetical protein
MTDKSASARGADDQDSQEPPNKEAGIARDVLATFHAEGVVDEPGRPAPLDPEESLPSDADIPPPQ